MNDKVLKKYNDPIDDFDVVNKQYVDDRLIKMLYPIGSIYMSVNPVNPSVLFGGTWQQITSDAYLKIVTSNAGTTNGTSSEHKIPVSSMPSHEHDIFYNTNDSGYGSGSVMGTTRTATNTKQYNDWGAFCVWSDSTGGGQAYYPYYYGVYVWTRTA